MSKTNPICRKCGVELNDENWCPSRQKKGDYICKSCHSKKVKQWKIKNPEKAKALSIRYIRKQGHQPFNKNKECALYLGVYIAEGVLRQAFKNVRQMPMSNPGYDFLCNRGKIDVKSSCLDKNGRWTFIINHNTIADYFLLLAFDDRKNLNPLHMWLIPGDVVNHTLGISIGPSTIHKWDAYRLDTTKVVACCNILKG